MAPVSGQLCSPFFILHLSVLFLNSAMEPLPNATWLANITQHAIHDNFYSFRESFLF